MASLIKGTRTVDGNGKKLVSAQLPLASLTRHVNDFKEN